MNFKYVLVWMIGAAQVTLAHAATIDVDTTIDSAIPENVEIVDGDSPPTTVGFVDGARVPQLLTSGSSVLNMFGGAVLDELGSQDDSLISVYAGLISDTQFGGASHVKFLDGTVEEDFTARDSAMIEISGGAFHEDVTLRDSSVLNISGGGLRGDIEARGQSTVNIYGGAFRSVVASNASTVNVFGFGLSLDDDMVTAGSRTANPQIFQWMWLPTGNSFSTRSLSQAHSFCYSDHCASFS